MSQLIWFRNSLRLHDNKILHTIQHDVPVKAIYIIPDRWLQNSRWGFPKMGGYRARFLLESLHELKRGLQALHIPLHIQVGDPASILTEFIAQHNISEVHTTKEWLQEERTDLEAARSGTPGVTWRNIFDNFLFDPEDLPYDTLGELPASFTPFRKRCEARVEVSAPLPIPDPWPQHNAGSGNEIPTLKSLGYENDNNPDPRSAFPFQGGYKSGLERMHAYFWERGNLSSYKQTRNGLLGTEYSSKLSAWLANGSLSPREIYAEVRAYEKAREKNQSTYWLIFELIWRDYFRYVSLKYGDRVFSSSGILGKERSWNSDKAARKAWTQGDTGNDFIDANMKELLHSGWMSNRGRQVVASYWAKELGQDWRIGASWFESQLIDYDVHSNWGNWMYQAGVGNDPRDRRFNIGKQAANYDPDGTFRNLWLVDRKIQTT